MPAKRQHLDPGLLQQQPSASDVSPTDRSISNFSSLDDHSNDQITKEKATGKIDSEQPVKKEQNGKTFWL